MLSVDITALFILLIIWILLIVLTRVFYNPIRKVMNERSSIVDGGKKSYEKVTAEYEKTLQDIEERVKAARVDALTSRDRIEEEAVQKKEGMLSDTNADYRKRISEAKDNLVKNMGRLKKEMKNQSGMLADQITEKILKS